jgi:hypothetical protein
MRWLLLTLALLVAATPPGLCACRLQEQLLPSLLSSNEDADDGCPDDEDGPGDCHCAVVKQPFVAPAAPPVRAADPMSVLVIGDPPALPESTAIAAVGLSGFRHPVSTPLYVTLRALRL